MVQGERRRYAPLQQPVHEPPVEVQALSVGRAAPLGLDAWPGDREAVCPQPQARHQVEVLFEAVVGWRESYGRVSVASNARTVVQLGVAVAGGRVIAVHARLQVE
jgi:hypothetical protein